MSATVRATRECYASEHELFDIGLASVELHATGLRSPIPLTVTRGESGDAVRMPARATASRTGDREILLLLSVFLHAGEVGIALVLAGLFELFDAARPIPGAMLTASGCVLAWFGWHGARAVIARAGRVPTRAS
jgi:hypothetical protein